MTTGSIASRDPVYSCSRGRAEKKCAIGEIPKAHYGANTVRHHGTVPLTGKGMAQAPAIALPL